MQAMREMEEDRSPPMMAGENNTLPAAIKFHHSRLKTDKMKKGA
jgi:hypothetical protein